MHDRVVFAKKWEFAKKEVEILALPDSQYLFKIFFQIAKFLFVLFLLSINDCIFDPNQMQIWSFIWNKLSILSFHKIASEFLCESLSIVLVLRLKLYKNIYKCTEIVIERQSDHNYDYCCRSYWDWKHKC